MTGDSLRGGGPGSKEEKCMAKPRGCRSLWTQALQPLKVPQNMTNLLQQDPLHSTANIHGTFRKGLNKKVKVRL